MNKKNFEYWRDEIYIKFQGNDEFIASMKANIFCQGQEIDILKARIIKLEKKYVKTNRKIKAFKKKD